MTPGGYNPEHFSLLAAAEDRHFWFRARSRLVEAVIKRTAIARRDLRVLEIGCGTGTMLRTLGRACPGARIVGMDLYAEGLRFARGRSAAYLVQGRVEQPPFATRFDIVGFFDVLEHLPDDLAALRHAHGLLEPDGRLVLTVPAHQWLWSDVDEIAGHCRRYEQPVLRARLQQAGYRVQLMTEFMSALVPLVWVSRKFARRRTGEEQLARELSVSPVLNTALEWALRPEAGWIAAGRGLPVGMSMIAVATPAGAAR
jgi:SAM-dependent methyltransferase